MASPVTTPEQEQVQEQVNTAVPEQVDKVDVETEQTYEYQPTDALGRPVGGKQAIKYKTPDELVEKLTKNHTQAIVHIRELNRKNRLGEFEVEDIPADAPKFDPDDLVLQPKPLSPEERTQLVRDLLDPDKFDDAQRRLDESRFGVTAEVLVKRVNKTREDAEILRATQEADAFVQAHPEYYVCADNYYTIANWMVKNGLSPVRKNFELAYAKLKPAGLLLERPIVREDAPATEVQAPVNTPSEPNRASRITSGDTAHVQRPVGVATGLTRNISSDVPSDNVPVKKLTLVEVESMSADEYKKRLLGDSSFRKEVDALYEDVANKRRAKGLPLR